MHPTHHDDLLLDRFDLSLLSALQKNAHTTHQTLGEAIHLSASQVSRRIQRLEQTGLIQAHVALVNPALLGLGVTAITYVTLSRHGTAEGTQFEKDVAGIAAVLECFAVTGESDYILKIVAADLTELSESVLQQLIRLPGVASIRSNIVLNCVKSTTQLPLDHLGKHTQRKRQVRFTERL
jgi:Lrp/AsnC family transcriptional regulator, leucine-responsive regulatory protein